MGTLRSVNRKFLDGTVGVLKICYATVGHFFVRYSPYSSIEMSRTSSQPGGFSPTSNLGRRWRAAYIFFRGKEDFFRLFISYFGCAAGFPRECVPWRRGEGRKKRRPRGQKPIPGEPRDLWMRGTRPPSERVRRSERHERYFMPRGQEGSGVVSRTMEDASTRRTLTTRGDTWAAHGATHWARRAIPRGPRHGRRSASGRGGLGPNQVRGFIGSLYFLCSESFD